MRCAMWKCRSCSTEGSVLGAGGEGDIYDDEEALLSNTLLRELGISSLLQRPDGRQLRTLWMSFGTDRDADGELVLSREQCCAFFRAVSSKYGDGTWGALHDVNNLQEVNSRSDNNDDDDVANCNPEPEGGVLHGNGENAAKMATVPVNEPSKRPLISVMVRARESRRRRRRSAIAMSRAFLVRAPPTSVSSLLLQSELVRWEAVRSKLWDEPVIRGVSSATVLKFQGYYLGKLAAAERNTSKQEMEHNEAETKLTQEDAIDLADEILSRARVPQTVNEAAQSAFTANNQDMISFLSFLRRIGPVYEKYDSAKVIEGLRDGSNNLPIDFDAIRSFAPEREDTPCEILNCGQATKTAMLNAIKAAEAEIMMSWWEFCPTVPAIRGPDLGNKAWIEDDDARIQDMRTLPPILKRKAEQGVKIYIVLNDVTINYHLVDYAIKTLGSAHPNIHVMRHPDWRVWAHTHHQKFIVVDRAIAVLGGVDWTVARWDLPSHPIFDEDASVHPGLELSVNGKRFKSDISEYWTQPHLDLTQTRSEQECSMWQDVAVCVRGDAANDVALNFLQRWEYARTQDDIRITVDSISSNAPIVLPAIPTYLNGSRSLALNANIAYSPQPIADGGFRSPGTAKACKCQIVRSLGDWSGGLKSTETSCYEAWISAINQAERFIYIEQQYTVSNMGVSEAKNRVGEAILRRVERAVKLSKPFRIYVVIPATVYMTVVNYFTRRTLLQDGRGLLNRREKSLMTRIQMILDKAAPGSYWDGQKAEGMLSVCTLASVGRNSSDRWEVGELFVHSKCIVVDDAVAVVGSANVNDRSFIGSSDSEIGAILWDDEHREDGERGCVHDFRLRLWRGYLGLPHDADESILNPESTEAFDLWCKTSSENQELISSVFSHFPSDNITSIKTYQRLQRAYKAKQPFERAASLKDPERLNRVRGLLTKYPPKFLGDENKRPLFHLLQGELPLKAYL